MAQRTQIIFTDDLDGSAASETIAFGLDGAEYEIDLSAEHADELRQALAPYQSAARQVSRRSRAGGRRGPIQTPNSTKRRGVAADPKAVRSWAQAQGLDVPARGRIPRHILTAFEAAH